MMRVAIQAQAIIKTVNRTALRKPDQLFETCVGLSKAWPLANTSMIPFPAMTMSMNSNGNATAPGTTRESMRTNLR